MATGDGWTSRLIRGLAEYLAAGGAGTWRPTGTYAAGEIAILDRLIPPSPDRIITLAAYPVTSRAPGMADTTVGVQIRCRGTVDPRVCDDMADAVYDLVDGVGLAIPRVTWAGVPIVQAWRQSYTSLGQDGNGRWERSDNYYVDAMRPTANNTD